MEIVPNPQWLWQLRRGSDTLRCQLVSLADRYELTLWKNQLLLDQRPHSDWAVLQALAQDIKAEYETDGWLPDDY